MQWTSSESERSRVYPPPSTLKADEIPFVVGVGRLVSQKGFDLLIQAHAEVLRRGVRHRLVLIGEGSDKQALAKLAAENGVAESVVFLGHIDNPYPVLVRASVFCLSPATKDDQWSWQKPPY